MFGNLDLPKYDVEVLTPSYLMRGKFQPRGDFMTYLNDPRWMGFHFEDVEMFPLAVDRQLKGVKRPTMNVHKAVIVSISLLDESLIKGLQLMQGHRPMVLYTAMFAMQGEVHVNGDNRDDDIFDETKQFYAVSSATIFPVQGVAVAPTRSVPLCAVREKMVQIYYVNR